jgi:CTP synthase
MVNAILALKPTNPPTHLTPSLTKESNLSTGKIYQSVIERERIGEYLGKTVQVVPHVSDAIQEWILRVAKQPVSQFSKSTSENNDGSIDSPPPEVCIVELGGTLGDIESMPFVEALRQLQENLGYKNMCFAHVSLVPTMGSPPEQKTKPTQHSVKQMMSMGLRPDFLCCRGTSPLEPSTVSKLSMFTSVPNDAVLSLHDVTNIYRVPLMMIEQNLHAMLLQRLRMGPFQRGMNYGNADQQVDIGESVVIRDWMKLADSVDEPESECVIAIVGKYIDQGDACEFQPIVVNVWILSSIAPCG